ncbi:MAG: nitroreductase family protein [Candidatus Korarchaeum sp.]|nr:nitroreductase family protein [Candidatus Korarchaeum sp.]MDW8035196.1 nitroreductase family protein [Candidatus Korarchaeum sp.]
MESCLNLLLTRRSVRKFEGREVSDEDIRRMLDAARYAPSARNSQPWEFVVVKDKRLIEELGRVHKYAYPLLDAPLAIVVLCDPKASPTSYLVDCANATLYLMLAAHALGIGSVWIQSLRDTESVNSIIGAPADRVPVAVLALGYPAESPSPPKRKDLRELVHLNKYGSRWE